METTDMIKWVRGNDINLLVYVKEPEIGNDGQPVKDASGNIVFIPVDLDAYDEWHLGITRCGIQATKYEIAASAGDTEGTIVATIPYTLPCGTYALEFTSRKNGQHIRSYELMMFGIVENNGEANVTFGVIAGERSLDIDLEVQYVAQAIARGKNAYEMWKELDGNEDKTLQDYIETVLDLYTITANCITATENAKADMILEDNYVYRWNAEQGRYVKTNIYVKGEQGVQGEQGIGIAGIEYSDTDENGNYIYDVYTTDDSVYQITSPRGPQGATGPAGQDGQDGSDGVTPHIDSTNKHWYIGDTDTNIVAEGVNGTNGTDGQDGQDGQDGVTPHIDPTSKHWYVGSTDTGILAEGKDGTDGQDGQDGQDGSDGVTPHIDSTSKHWMIGNTDTGVVAEGQDGQDGQNGQPGADGITPHIDSTTKHWMIGDVDTGIVAEGTTPDLSNYVQKSSTTGLLKNDGTVDTTEYSYVTFRTWSTT